MRIIISTSSAQPICRQIAGQIRAEILAGRLKERTALPSIRALAHDLRVGVMTAKRAYDQLQRDGFVHAAGEQRIFVAGRIPSRDGRKRTKRREERRNPAFDTRRMLRELSREVAVAGEVQRRFLPQKAAPMRTVDYAGRCRQARTVGGDYYDFLDLGSGHLGLVLADVSGKGLYAALLMANLQASLRSLSSRAATDLASALESVNRSFYASTAGNHFATLFAAHYDDGTRRMRYVNCGHCPPLLLRATGEVERFAVTSTALGMFETSNCESRETELGPDDVLAIFSDGVTDATDASGEEFGEARLLDALCAHARGPAVAVVDGVMASVLDFSAHARHDDMTVVVARGRDRQD